MATLSWLCIVASLLAVHSTPMDRMKFYHGVASGDATSQDLIIWTRATPPFQNEYAMDRNDTFNDAQLDVLKFLFQNITIEWAISESADSINFHCADSKCGVTETSIDIDYTVKVKVDRLTANTWYYYQFKVGSVTSEIGRSRTIPSSYSEKISWKFAFASCKRWGYGFFNNLGDIAEKEDLDMMVWLGDYIYEITKDDGAAIGRIPFPDRDLYTLAQYRRRYLQHKLDVNVQKLERKLPWYILWDDHDVIDDYWKDGAPEENQLENSLYGINFQQRKMNAYQAFFEWLPVRNIDVDANGGLYQSLSFGNLFDLILVDGRSQKTEPPANVSHGALLSADEHYVFGQKQRDWMINELNKSQRKGTKWRLIGNNNVFGQSPPKDVFGGRDFFGIDRLQAYDAERQIIFDAIVHNNINNVINLAGGPHTGVAQKLYSTGKPIKNDPDSYAIFTEFVADAISSAKTQEREHWLPYLDKYKEEWSWVSPYFRLLVDGYCIIEIDYNKAKVEFWVNDNIRVPDSKSYLDATFCVYNDRVEFDECDDSMDNDESDDKRHDVSVEVSLDFDDESDESDDSDDESDDERDDKRHRMSVDDSMDNDDSGSDDESNENSLLKNGENDEQGIYDNDEEVNGNSIIYGSVIAVGVLLISGLVIGVLCFCNKQKSRKGHVIVNNDSESEDQDVTELVESGNPHGVIEQTPMFAE